MTIKSNLRMNFLLMREIHAQCVKISRMRQFIGNWLEIGAIFHWGFR